MSEYQKLFEKNLKELVDYQIKYTVENFGFFNSFHEFYAVLLQEIENSNVEIIAVNSHIKQIWKEIKIDKFDIYTLDKLRIYTYNSIKNLIQVISAIDKIEIKKRND